MSWSPTPLQSESARLGQVPAAQESYSARCAVHHPTPVSGAYCSWLPAFDPLEPYTATHDAHNGVRGDSKAPKRKRRTWKPKTPVKPFLTVATYLHKALNEYINSDSRASVPRPESRKRHITPDEWSQFGRWARPSIDGTYVRNRTPRPPPPDWHPSHGIPNLRGPNGSPHPERWIPGLLHPNIPPRPTAWHTPRAGSPIPLPQETQLNPLLEHTALGWTPMTFFINLPAVRIMYTGLRRAHDLLLPLPDEDFAQPATHPLITDLVIAAVADDTADCFPWPIHVHNRWGVNCGDVFDAIYTTFQEHMTWDEYDELSPRRKEQIQRSYWARVNTPANGGVVPGDHDGLRRIDYFVDRILFRGLEPSPNGDSSWVMFLGPA